MSGKKWLEHSERMNEDLIQNMLYQYQLKDRRSHGRPTKRRKQHV